MKSCCEEVDVDDKRSSKGLLYYLSRLIAFPFILLIRFYQLVISPWLGPRCRFQPTCSQYGLEAFRKHNPVKALYLTMRRIARCHPWGGHGYDPVP